MSKDLRVSPLVVAAITCLVVAVGGIGYVLGLQHQKDTVQSLKEQQLTRESDYAKALQTVTNERDRVSNDYDSACAEFQELHAAYEQLFAKAGATSGLSHYVVPDSARGNEESCYR